MAGLLLTGGASRRMGETKALIPVSGGPLAQRTARLLEQVAGPLFEVGPGYSGLSHVVEPHPGAGPLVAIGAGVDALRAAGYRGPALVLATDLPRLDVGTLEALARWPGSTSVVPCVQDRRQPLCARWSAADLDAVAELVAAGERSLRPLLSRHGVEFVHDLNPDALTDADTPEELAALLLPGQRE